VTDDELARIIRVMANEVEIGHTVVVVETASFHRLAVHTLGLRQAVRNLADRVPLDSEIRQDMLKLIGEEITDPEETHDRVVEQIRQRGMRDHVFQGDGIHCKHWSSTAQVSSTSGNTLTFSSECGYPRDLHPSEVSE
jgi:hypothetical protein